uniref:Secreted protein n=1 Tax=Ixodes ricinus TaxID=34613 RepID=A0A6B0V5I1_IXORI
MPSFFSAMSFRTCISLYSSLLILRAVLRATMSASRASSLARSACRSRACCLDAWARRCRGAGGFGGASPRGWRASPMESREAATPARASLRQSGPWSSLPYTRSVASWASSLSLSAGSGASCSARAATARCSEQAACSTCPRLRTFASSCSRAGPDKATGPSSVGRRRRSLRVPWSASAAEAKAASRSAARSPASELSRRRTQPRAHCTASQASPRQRRPSASSCPSSRSSPDRCTAYRLSK